MDQIPNEPAGPGRIPPTPHSFAAPAPRPRPANPRRVRGGVKLPAAGAEGPVAWAAHRFLRLVEGVGSGECLREGLEYAKAGQTKRMNVVHGCVEAAIQGRADRPYTVSLRFGTMSPNDWARVVEAMAEGAIYAAKLLAGELPSNIEDVFIPLGLKLFPGEASEITPECTCAEHRAARQGLPVPPWPGETGEPRPGQIWCKHVCCLSYLLASRLAHEPFLMFHIRGLEGVELLEQLRDRRSAGRQGARGETPVYQQRVPGVADVTFRPIEECVTDFWEAGPALEQIDLPLTPPPVSHPLLRRLGPSPFANAQFPLVGLLASVYDVVGDAVRKEAEGEAGTPSDV